MSATEPQLIGGRYEVRYRLGASTATEVLLARDRELDRDVAVKVLTPQYAADPVVVDGFRRMAAIAAPLRHPGIVEIYDVGETAQTGPYIVMERVDGPSLAELIRQEPMAVTRSAAIGAAVADALGAAHRQGAIHGSLTARDVLLGMDGSVKLTDLGAAAAGIASVVETPLDVATYAPPERLQGQPADAAGDLYALGVLLHESVTGAPPFTGTDAVAVTRQKLERAPLPPSTAVASVPPAFDAVVERLTSPVLARRYRSAEEVAADLRRIQEPPTRTAALPITPVVATPVTPPAKSNAGWIVAAILLLLIVGGGLAWLFTDDDGSAEEKAKVEVPAVVGQPAIVAQDPITKAGLRATTVNQINETIPAGTVFDQSPPGKSLAPVDSVVKLTVSAGPTPTTSTTTTTTSTTTTTTTTTTTLPTSTSSDTTPP